jgi:survival of motor neuron protein-interacting protein 1
MKKETIRVKPDQEVPSQDDVEGWCRLCFGRLQPHRQDSVGGESVGGMQPVLGTLVQMDQPTVLAVLEYHINWLQATGFSQHQGCWFYALLVCLEKPLCPEGCSLLRMLARLCSHLRASLDSPEDLLLAPLNLLICLISHYFEQMDLADNG